MDTLTFDVVGLLLQSGVNVDLTQPGPLDVVSSAIGAFVTTLVVGAIMIAIAPEYVERTMGTLEDAPVGSFLYGLLCLLGLVLVTVVLVITVIGILVAVPLILLAVVTWAVGAAIAYLAIAERLVGREEGWTKPLLVAAALNGGLTLTGVGGLVAFGIGAAGFGAVLKDRLG